HDGCERDKGEGKVEYTDIADEMLVERTVGTDPHLAETREILVERSRCERGPRADDDRRDTEPDEHDASRARVHTRRLGSRRTGCAVNGGDGAHDGSPLLLLRSSR